MILQSSGLHDVCDSVPIILQGQSSRGRVGDGIENQGPQFLVRRCFLPC